MARPPTARSQDDATGRTIHAYEPRAVPWLSVVFGYGPMLPFVAGGGWSGCWAGRWPRRSSP